MSTQTPTQILTKPISTTSKIIELISEQITIYILKQLTIYHFFKDKSSYNIYYHSDLETLSKLYTDTYQPKVSHNRCDIIIEPIYNPKDLDNVVFNFSHDYTTGLTRKSINDLQPIFIDSKYNITLYELGIPSGIRLTFNIKVKSIQKADIIMSQLYSRYYSGKIFQYTDLTYDYNIPLEILYTMYELFKLRRISKDFKFISYLKLGSNKNIDIAIDKTKLLEKSDNQSFAVNVIKNQVFSNVKIEFDIKKPESEKKNKIPDRFQIEFQVTLGYKRPMSLQLHYPLMVNNRPIPESIILNPSPGINTVEKDYVHDDLAVNNFIYYSNKLPLFRKYKTIIYPKSDTIIPIKRMLSPEHIPIFQGVLQVDKDAFEKNYLEIDIQNEIFPLIKKYHDINAIRDILVTQKDRSKSQYSLVNILLVKDLPKFTIIEKSHYSINDSLKIRIRKNIQDTSIYRILISLNTNMKLLDKDLVYKLFEYPEYLDKVILKNLNHLIDNRYIEIKEISPLERDSFFNNQPIYQPGNIHPGTILKGERHGPYEPFRIGNFIIIPRPI